MSGIPAYTLVPTGDPDGVLAIHGNTYKWRHDMAVTLGGVFNKEKKQWEFSADKQAAAAARVIVYNKLVAAKRSAAGKKAASTRGVNKEMREKVEKRRLQIAAQNQLEEHTLQTNYSAWLISPYYTDISYVANVRYPQPPGRPEHDGSTDKCYYCKRYILGSQSQRNTTSPVRGAEKPRFMIDGENTYYYHHNNK